MGKLKIVFRIKDHEDDYYKGQTYSCFTLENKITTISIAPNETRKLSDIVYGIERDLQDGFHLDKDEKFDIDDFNKSIMEYEELKGERVDNNVHNILELLYEPLEEGKIANIDEALAYVEEVISND